MRVVVYDQEDMEPITIIDLPSWATARLKNGETIRWAADIPVSMEMIRADDSMNLQFDRHIASLRFMEIRKGRGEHLMWLCVTEDAQTALMFRSVFLPGQRREVQRREEGAFMVGMLSAFQR